MPAIVKNVYFGSTPATNIFVFDDTSLSCDNPAHDKGPVTITVEMDDGSTGTSVGPIFTYEQYSWNLENPTLPRRVGDKIKFTANPGSEGTLRHILQIQFSYTPPGGSLRVIAINTGIGFDGVQTVFFKFNPLTYTPIPGPMDIVFNNVYPIFIQEPDLIFYIPIIFNPTGLDPTSFNQTGFNPLGFNFNPFTDPAGTTVTITFIGDGTQFSGSIIAGTILVLPEDASGIYTLVRNKTNDTLYLRNGYTTDISLLMLPSEEDKIYEDDFFSLLSYPKKILSQSYLDEDYEAEDLSIISTLRVLVTLEDVEIPSPFIKTAFLP